MCVLELFVFSAWLISISVKFASQFCLIPLAIQLTLVAFLNTYIYAGLQGGSGKIVMPSLH